MRFLLPFVLAVVLPSQQPVAFEPLGFLMGNWTAAEGRGGCSFEPDLRGKVVVRRNYSIDASGTRHEDLMVIYLEPSPRAIYFDSEGHVIRYTISFPGPSAAVFESEPGQGGPRYRLAYNAVQTKVRGKFEIAPPGGGEYKTYLSWTLERR